MDKESVKTFFDEKASVWDAVDETQPEIIKRILDNAQIQGNLRLLDVGCGTGVMIPFYLERGVNEITAIDLSPEMIKIAREKFPDSPVKFIAGDIEESDDELLEGEDGFDRIVMYNAFPHFPDPKKVIEILCEKLSSGGIFTIAHGKSREVIDAHHKGAASHVSRGLMSIEELAKLFPTNTAELIRVSDDKMYQIVVRRL